MKNSEVNFQAPQHLVTFFSQQLPPEYDNIFPNHVFFFPSHSAIRGNSRARSIEFYGNEWRVLGGWGMDHGRYI